MFFLPSKFFTGQSTPTCCYWTVIRVYVFHIWFPLLPAAEACCSVDLLKRERDNGSGHKNILSRHLGARDRLFAQNNLDNAEISRII
jgi:hypothetical protein